MRILRLRMLAYAFGFMLGVAGIVGAVAAPAMAVGAEVYRTDSQGNETSAIVHVGNTSPACCCVWDGEGLVGLGVKVCYLPL